MTDEEREEAVQAEVDAQDIREEARRRRAGNGWTPPACLDSGDLALHRPDWLVQDYIEQGTVGLLVGAYGTAKTFLALAWACCIAAGLRWHGRKVKICNVLYIVAEGAQGIGNRKRAWEITNVVIEKHGLVFITGTVPLDNPFAVDWLKQQIKSYEADVVFIDTIARNKGGVAENDGDDVGRLIEVMYELRDVRGDNMTTVIGLHHKGKDGSRGARGSSRFGSDVDFLHELAEKDGTYTLSTDKMKDGGKAAPWHFTLREVEVKPTRGELEAITSCVIEPTSAPIWTPPAKEDSDQALLDYLTDHPGSLPGAIAKAFGRADDENTRKQLRRLEKTGQTRAEQTRRRGPTAWFRV